MPVARQTDNTGQSAAEAASADRTPDAMATRLIVIARQPIFDMSKAVSGYELLFRTGRENSFTGDDPTISTRKIIHNVLHVVGLETLVNGKSVFINVTPQTLLEQSYTVLPADRTVLELPASERLTPELKTACQQARDAGFRIALDNVVHNSLSGSEGAWLEVVDIAKIVMHNDEAGVRKLVNHLKDRGKVTVAINVETPEAFDQAVAANFDHTQGYFFCEPEILSARELTAAEHIQVQFLAELEADPIDFDKVVRLIKSDAALSYNLLKYLNSPAFSIPKKITSIKQAVHMLGEQQLRRWGSLAAVSAVSRGKPNELLLMSLMRARFCETLATRQGLSDREMDLFLIGLLSALDAIVDMPMDKALEPLHLEDDVRAALLGDRSQPPGQILQLVLACERGGWGTVNSLCAELSLAQHEVASMHFETMRWVHSL